MQGAVNIARTLHALGVRVIFGIVGIPVMEVAEACRQEGIRFIGFRNEQAASYAAGAWGYMTGQPGVCLVVSGPGVVHALAGVANAQENCWPMLLLAGSSERHMTGNGAFQELDQVAVCRPFCKFAEQPRDHAHLPSVLLRAYSMAMQGRPGPVYVDLPADLIQETIASAPTSITLDTPGLVPCAAAPSAIQAAADLLVAAERPLIIVGKGAAYAQVEALVVKLVETTGIPFLPTPMGKGVVPDNHPRCVSAARSLALKQADVVLALGARFNWILHYGAAPRFSQHVKIIQVDVSVDEMGRSRPVDVPLVGHLQLILPQLLLALEGRPVSMAAEYLATLDAKVKQNEASMAKRIAQPSMPLNYHYTFGVIRRCLPDDTVFVSEGANTMDISRGIFPVQTPRTRLDAGTMGAMGPALGYAIAAQIQYPKQRVVAIVGDSAFGFSAMELETAARYKLPLIVIIINNNGIYAGIDEAKYDTMSKDPLNLPTSSLLPDARYELMGEAFHGHGHLCRTGEEIEAALQAAFAETTRISVINILIETGDITSKLSFGWQG